MCLAIPGQIVSIEGEEFSRTGKINFSGIVKEINLAFVPEAEIGNWVIVHAGVALNVLDEEAARETLATIDEINSQEG
jgi:hydrogenase expression/formation protein HypC